MKIGVLRGNDSLVYGSIGVFNEELVNGFNSIGHEAKSCYNFNDIDDIMDFTIGFGTCAYTKNNSTNFEILKKPHFAWIIDHPIQCDISYIRSNYLYHIAIDMEHQMVLEQLGNKCFFLPLGTKKYSGENEEKKYDVVFPCAIEDPNKRYESWKQNSQNTFNGLSKISEICLSDLNIPPFIHMQKIEFIRETPLKEQGYVFSEVNKFVRSYKRRVVLNAIKDHEVHVFGEIDDKEILSKKNIICHGDVDYNKTYELFAQAKIVVNVSPNYCQGSHDRVLVAAEHGAVVLSDENSYLSEKFKSEKDILFYKFNDLKSLDEKIELVLKNDNISNNIVKNARLKIENNFTWEEKCKNIIEFAQYAANYSKWFL